MYPALKICIYPPDMDIWVSAGVRGYGGWEMGITQSIINAFVKYPRAVFLDIGANVGMHGLTVAKYGQHVYAVEPQLSTVMRLHKSVNLNGLRSKFTLIKNAVSNRRGTLRLYSDDENQGGSTVVSGLVNATRQETVSTILFDDLLEVVNSSSTDEVIIKIDIEGSEARAFTQSTKFFQQLKVRAIFMEWMTLKLFLPANRTAQPSEDAALVLDMVARLRAAGFEPRYPDASFEFRTHMPLDYRHMLLWPNDVVWIRPWPGIPFEGSRNRGAVV